MKNQVAFHVHDASGRKGTVGLHDDGIDALRYALTSAVPLSRWRRVKGWLWNKWCGVVLWLVKRGKCPGWLLMWKVEKDGGRK